MFRCERLRFDRLVAGSADFGSADYHNSADVCPSHDFWWRDWRPRIERARPD